MRPVRPGNETGPGGEQAGEEVRVTSVILGLVMVIALIVTAAAWMGGSLSQAESRIANFNDTMARTLGVAVSDVAVIGLEHDAELSGQIRAAAMIEPGENMFRADPRAIRERIRATGKVVNVRVHRLWPDQLVIMADPADPLAIWTHDGRPAVIDELGRVMPGLEADAFAGLPRLSGESAPEAAPGLLARLEKALALKARFVKAERIGSRRWRVYFEGDVQVDFPEDAALDAAMDRLAAKQAAHDLLDRPLAAIDLRAGNQLVMRPRRQPEREGAA
ncbi:MAG: FtsQ-type POTRA domain-containing protein [Alphaproteobacteria bacterium]|jgi:cell division protein FtsQ|nr:FtsQ-type POTRA domain-containing protein [Alphaproteobacteria bacterium]